MCWMRGIRQLPVQHFPSEWRPLRLNTYLHISMIAMLESSPASIGGAASPRAVCVLGVLRYRWWWDWMCRRSRLRPPVTRDGPDSSCGVMNGAEWVISPMKRTMSQVPAFPIGPESYIWTLKAVCNVYALRHGDGAGRRCVTLSKRFQPIRKQLCHRADVTR